MGSGMLFQFIVVVLIFAAGGVFGQLLPDLWAGEAVSLIAVAADLATLCAAGAAIYALGAWRQQIRSQKAYEVLSQAIRSCRDKGFSIDVMTASKGVGVDKYFHNLQIFFRDARRAADELSVLGYGEHGTGLHKAAVQLRADLASLAKKQEKGTVLDIFVRAEDALGAYVDEIYSSQKAILRSGLW